ncbi:uncharacterized protein [Ptychodera flava]|uniref:uncharacterized protein n=1 Tax=Ptychodera flava TaxID=63121 RepID=UPI003969ED67
MINLYKFAEEQNMESKQRMPLTASVVEIKSSESDNQDVEVDDCSLASSVSDSSLDGSSCNEDLTHELVTSSSMQSLSSTSSYFSCEEEVQNSASGSDSDGSAIDPKSSTASASSSKSDSGIENTSLQSSIDSVEQLADSASVHIAENVPSENHKLDKESMVSDFMSFKHDSPVKHDVKGHSSDDKLSVREAKSMQIVDSEQVTKQPRRRHRSRVQRILRWFTKCIRPQESTDN